VFLVALHGFPVFSVISGMNAAVRSAPFSMAMHGKKLAAAKNNCSFFLLFNHKVLSNEHTFFMHNNKPIAEL
jgi:hypothetical protein